MKKLKCILLSEKKANLKGYILYDSILEKANSGDKEKISGCGAVGVWGMNRQTQRIFRALKI